MSQAVVQTAVSGDRQLKRVHDDFTVFTVILSCVRDSRACPGSRNSTFLRDVIIKVLSLVVPAAIVHETPWVPSWLPDCLFHSK